MRMGNGKKDVWLLHIQNIQLISSSLPHYGQSICLVSQVANLQCSVEKSLLFSIGSNCEFLGFSFPLPTRWVVTPLFAFRMLTFIDLFSLPVITDHFLFVFRICNFLNHIYILILFPLGAEITQFSIPD